MLIKEFRVEIYLNAIMRRLSIRESARKQIMSVDRFKGSAGKQQNTQNTVTPASPVFAAIVS